MKNCMLSIKFNRIFGCIFEILGSKTYKSIYTMFFAHIFAIFLHMHGSWASVWKFWLHFWNAWPQKHVNRYTTCILHTFLQIFFACAWALGKFIKVLVTFLKFLAPKTYKSIYNMYFAHIFAIFLRVHGLWISVRKFWLHFRNPWPKIPLFWCISCLKKSFK